MGLKLWDFRQIVMTLTKTSNTPVQEICFDLVCGWKMEVEAGAMVMIVM